MMAKFPNNRYIYCSYQDKDECKIKGGKWDTITKMWYIPKGVSDELFTKWLYPYTNIDNYIESNIVYWVFHNFHIRQDYHAIDGDRGIGKWLVMIKAHSTDISNLRYLLKTPGVTGFKIWQDQHLIANNVFTKEDACICIYCGVKRYTFEQQIDWIKYIGFRISNDKYLKLISLKPKIFFKTNADTNKGAYSFNSVSVSKLAFNFIEVV